MSQFLNVMWYVTSALLIIVILLQNPKAEGAGLKINNL
nr:SecG [Sahlingia subintegra]